MSFQTQEIQDLILSFPPLNGLSPCKKSKISGADPALHWIGDASEKWPFTWNHPRLSLFWAHHGFSTPHSIEIAESSLERCLNGTSGLNRLAEAANMDLRLYEMDLSTPTANILDKSDTSMTAEELARAIAYGMMSVEPDLDFLAIGANGAGTNDCATAIINIHAHHNNAALPSPTSLQQQITSKAGDALGLDALQVIGGFEIAALCGAIISARLAHIPVLADGYTGLAAYLILKQYNPNAVAHVRLINVPHYSDNAILNLPIPASTDAGVALAFAASFIRNLIIVSEGAAVSPKQESGCGNPSCGSSSGCAA